jgi:hypothetical protein
MGLDNFGRFSPANGEVKISEGGGGSIVGQSGEQPGENGVKVDRRS